MIKAGFNNIIFFIITIYIHVHPINHYLLLKLLNQPVEISKGVENKSEIHKNEGYEVNFIIITHISSFLIQWPLFVAHGSTTRKGIIYYPLLYLIPRCT